MDGQGQEAQLVSQEELNGFITSLFKGGKPVQQDEPWDGTIPEGVIIPEDTEFATEDEVKGFITSLFE